MLKRAKETFYWLKLITKICIPNHLNPPWTSKSVAFIPVTKNANMPIFFNSEWGSNPDYDNEKNGKCPESDQETPVAPHIETWFEDKAEINVHHAKKIVIPQQTVSIQFRYPFSDTFTFEFKADTAEGFTLAYLIDCICRKYKEMYDEENSAVQVSTAEERLARGGLLNREKTNGKFGIWGHDISDLYLEGITYNASNNTVVLSIGS